MTEQQIQELIISNNALRANIQATNELLIKLLTELSKLNKNTNLF